MSLLSRIAAFATLLIATASCGGDSVAPAAGTPKDPKSVIAQQLELLKAGNVSALKAGMTERLREMITPEAVDKGKASAAQYTIDDLVDSLENGTDEGRKTVKIKMKNGRTLTTLVEVDGKWLADTIWFK